MDPRAVPLGEAGTVEEKRWSILVVLCLSLVIVIVGNTVLNVALPTLADPERGLGATTSEQQWFVDAYALVFAGLLLTAGALGDRFGRKGALQIGLVVVAGASLVAAFADDSATLIGARAVMGAGAAFVMPATLSILSAVFPPGERARAIAIWAGLSGAGAAIGPIAGGYLVESFWWGSVFLVNLPFVVLALVAGQVLVPTSSDPAHPPLDPVGAALSVLGLSALVFAIIEAPAVGWTDPETLGVLGLAAAVLGAFSWWELRTEHPMLDLRFFRDPRFSAASGAITLVFFAMFGMFFLMTQFFQLVLGYSPLEAGVRLLPTACAIVLVAPRSAGLAVRFGARRVIASGLATVSVGLVLIFLTTDLDTPYWMIAVTMVVIASGMGLTIAPSTASIMGALPLGKAGVGSAVNDTTRELGGALGVAVLGSLLASQYREALGSTLADLPSELTGPISSSLGLAVRTGREVIGGTAGEAVVLAAQQAYIDGMRLALLVAAGVALAAAVLVLRFLPEAAAAQGRPMLRGDVDPAVDREPAPAPGG